MLNTIVGHRGFIGSHLSAALFAKGEELFLPGRDDPELLRRHLGTVYYCAGFTADFGKHPRQTVEAHAGLLSRILDAGKFDGLVYLSSTRLYDSLGTVRAGEEADLVLNPKNPRHIFDLSKALGESLCIQAGHSRARVARLSSVYEDGMNASNFLSALVRQALDSKRVEIATSPLLERDYIHMSDVLTLLQEIAVGGKGGIYNVASGRNVSNGTIFNLIKQVLGCEIVTSGIEQLPSPRIEISRIESEFGAQPRTVEELLPAILLRCKTEMKGAA